MKNEFDILNNIEIDTNEYKEVKFDNNDEIKKRMRLKIKKRNSSYKKAIAIASFVIVLGGGLACNKTVWANVENMWYSLQSILDLKNEEVINYKYEINKSVESNNIKVTYKNLMIDDGNLIVEIGVDDSNFDPTKDFTEKQKKDWYVDKWGNEETFINIGNIDIYVDGEKRGILHKGQEDYENKARDSKGITNIVSKISLNEKGDENIVKQVEKYQFPYVIDKNRIYNIKLNTDKIHILTGYIKDEKVSYSGVIKGDWSVELPIKGEDLIKATVKYDDYKIDKNIKINIDGVDKKIKIDSLRLSPIYTKLKHTIDLEGYDVSDKYDIEIKLENENGEEYQMQKTTTNYNEQKNCLEVETEYRNIFKESKKIKLTPLVTNFKTGEYIEQESINIDLDK